MKNIRECTTEEVCQMLNALKYRIIAILKDDDLSYSDVIDEAVRRLEIKPRKIFNDEQFNI